MQNAKGCQLVTRQNFNLHIFLKQKVQKTNIALSLQAFVKFHQTNTDLMYIMSVVVYGMNKSSAVKFSYNLSMILSSVYL